ncbi:ester cyclase [Tunturiibacter gelidoferens]|uniref:Ester cyclase n=1 Tax=Tunturiibacter gelidiferens TaxID=3069689 RepID=A0ACC5NZJ6_9BACT|nr:ester cyclase [Edaphobacter lichenicola]MBB5339970.1 putative ester cyclase [Edaphobacter lichenicola]
MSLAANKALAQRWFEEVWNQGKESTIDELFHPQGKGYGFPEPHSILIGPEAFKAIHRQFHSAFGDIHITIDDLVAEGDRVAIRWTATMKHTGDGLGFPATGKTATLPGASFITCRDGIMTEGWNSMDMTKLTLQLQERDAQI